MKHILLLPALLLAAPAHAAVVRFDFVSEVSVYQDDAFCLEDNGADEGYCLGKKAPILGQFILDVSDPRNIDFYAEWVDDLSSQPVDSSGTILSVSAESAGQIAWGAVSAYLSVRTVALDQYDILMILAKNDPDFVFDNISAGWGGAGSPYYTASGFWTATVVEPAPAPVPLPASGFLMLGLLPIGAGIRRLAGRSAKA